MAGDFAVIAAQEAGVSSELVGAGVSVDALGGVDQYFSPGQSGELHLDFAYNIPYVSDIIAEAVRRGAGLGQGFWEGNTYVIPFTYSQVSSPYAYEPGVAYPAALPLVGIGLFALVALIIKGLAILTGLFLAWKVYRTIQPGQPAAPGTIAAIGAGLGLLVLAVIFFMSRGKG